MSDCTTKCPSKSPCLKGILVFGAIAGVIAFFLKKKKCNG
ncbi:hypothetical protein SXCC_01799 [Gluconacetobacter sp. SXCC-1]|nr:hypothetical protein SXCC_01799 [Gluconacetobacter sp. SXCC-1]SAY49571.1 hypothetical protein KRIGEM_02546 [Komagataeibacter rhaeticus]